MLKMFRNKKGQSIVEYIIVWAAIIAAVVGLAYAALSGGVGDILDNSATVMSNAASSFSEWVPQPNTNPN